MENDENDLIVDKLIPQFENHKISYGKNSTSGAPRKKILADISESLSNSVSENAVSSEAKDDSSLKVYDPVLNYLSPRPQYLRFNPNRRREIFTRLEKESDSSLDSEELSAEEIEDSSLSPNGFAVNRRNGGIGREVSDNGSDGYEEEKEIDEVTTDSSSLSPPEGSDVNRRNGGQCEEDHGDVADGYEMEEEEEEEIEERGWCLGGVLKLVLTLIACFLSTSYICSMNSPTDSPTQQAIWDFNDSGFLIKNETLEFVSTELQDRGFCDRDNSIEDVEVDDESYNEFDESLEAEILEYLEMDEEEMVGNENEDSEGVSDEAAEFDESVEAEIVEYLEMDETEMDGNENEGSEDDEAAEVEYIEDVLEHMMIDAETDENSETDILLGTDSDNAKNEASSETEIIGYGAVDTEAQSLGQSIEVDEIDDDAEVDEELSDFMDEVDEIGDAAEVEMEKSEWNASTVVVVSAVLVVSASLAIVYQLKKSRRSSSSEESEPVLKQKLAVEENVLPSIDRRVEFLARAPLLSHSTREASRELTLQIHAPIVELIGEIVVGRQPSSLRNSSKFQMTISEEESNATLFEKHGSLPRLVPAPSKPSAMETSSTSFGSLTTERKISKKEV